MSGRAAYAALDTYFYEHRRRCHCAVQVRHQGRAPAARPSPAAARSASSTVGGTEYTGKVVDSGRIARRTAPCLRSRKATIPDEAKLFDIKVEALGKVQDHQGSPAASARTAAPAAPRLTTRAPAQPASGREARQPRRAVGDDRHRQPGRGLQLPPRAAGARSFTAGMQAGAASVAVPPASRAARQIVMAISG